MGIRIHRNTWSAPLQFIDCWLPSPEAPLNSPASLSRVASRFVKAGWIHRKACNDTITSAPQQASTKTGLTAVTVLPRVASHARSNGPTDGRLRISGRLADVCAELERLAADGTPQQIPRG